MSRECIQRENEKQRFDSHPGGGGQSGTVRDLIMLLRIIHILKLMNCLFMEFSMKNFWIAVDHGQLKRQ